MGSDHQGVGAGGDDKKDGKRKESLIGRRFGQWLVTDEVRGRGGYCLCKCACGTERKVFRGSLVTGASKGCGCSRHSNLVGQQFGSLHVQHESKKECAIGKFTASFICLCECGKEVNVLPSDLLDGSVKSCGCWRSKRIPNGTVFGRLTVEDKVFRQYRWLYLCRCSCGQTSEVAASMLQRGVTKSCGCLAREIATQGLQPGQAACNGLFLRCKKNAEVRNLTFDLTISEAETLFKQDCYYCGLPPSMEYTRPSGNYTYNGLDRLDNLQGYITSNVVASCWGCNRSKAQQTMDDFIAWASRVHAPVYTVHHVSDTTVPERAKHQKYVYAAKERQLDFNLTRDQSIAMFREPCGYCGEAKTLSGIDRLDNTSGYDLANCVPACKICNYAKGPQTASAFLAWAARFQAYRHSISSR